MSKGADTDGKGLKQIIEEAQRDGTFVPYDETQFSIKWFEKVIKDLFNNEYNRTTEGMGDNVQAGTKNKAEER